MQTHSAEGANERTGDEQRLTQLLEIQGLEGFLEVERRRQQDDQAKNVAVILSVGRTEPGVGDPAVNDESGATNAMNPEPKVPFAFRVDHLREEGNRSGQSGDNGADSVPRGALGTAGPATNFVIGVEKGQRRDDSGRHGDEGRHRDIRQGHGSGEDRAGEE